MYLKWTAVRMLEAARVRKIIGYQHPARLAVEVTLPLSTQRPPSPPQPSPPLPSRPPGQRTAAGFHG